MLDITQSAYFATQDMKIKGKKNIYLNGMIKPSSTVMAYTSIVNGLDKQMKELQEKQEKQVK